VKESRAIAEAEWNRMRSDTDGFRSLGIDASPDQIRLDTGVPVFWLTMQNVLDIADGKTTLEAAAQSKDVVYPLVTTNGTGTSVMTMTRSENGWRQNSFGRGTLARNLTSVKAKDAKPAADYFAVEVPSLRRVFLARGRGVGTMIIPLDTEESLGFTSGQEVQVREAMQRLQKYFNERRKPQM